jgi:hypothetical protein
MSNLALEIFKRLKGIAERYVAEIQLFRPGKVKRARDDFDQSPESSISERVSCKLRASPDSQHIAVQSDIFRAEWP